MKKLIFSFVAALMLISSVAVSAETPEWRAWPLGQRLDVGLSLYRPNIDTRMTLTDGPIVGIIDFEQNLGLKDTESTPQVDLRWRMFKRHSLRFNYFNLDRSGAGVTGGTLGFGDCSVPPVASPDCVVLNPDVPVNSFVDIEVFNFAYDFSIFFTERLDWSVGIGFSLQDFDVGIISDAPDIPAQSQTKFTAPLPTLATKFSYAINDKWILDVGLNWLEIDLDLDSSGKFDGRILAFDTGVRWHAFENVGFFLKYSSFDLEIDVDDGADFAGFIDYNYRGPRLGADVYF